MRELHVRPLTTEDTNSVLEIFDNSFSKPDFDSALYLSKKVIEVNGKIVAAGLCRLTSEGILIADMNQPLTIRTRAIKELIDVMIEDSYDMGMDECHMFTGNDEITNLLSKLGFVLCKGTAMVTHYGKSR